MNINQIELDLIRHGYDTSANSTQQNLYSGINRDQLFSGANRLNSGWSRGKYVLAKWDNSAHSDQDCITRWVTLVQKYGDQILVLEDQAGQCTFYDHGGTPIPQLNIQIPHQNPVKVVPTQSGFTCYLKTLNIPPSIGKYVSVVDNRGVKQIILQKTGKNSIYEISDLNIVKSIIQDVRQSQFDINGQRLYSSALGHYKDFLGVLFPATASSASATHLSYLAALRAKPFLLLAGISGTGKSRIVRKMAQACVPQSLQEQYDGVQYGANFDRWSIHKPANFELIQVKPNWHNSLEVVGYKSNIGGSHYEFTPFVEFVARAWKHPEVPFFLCLDEMNLAPVEQYFAEFLSAIESRSKENGVYETDPIIKPFKDFGQSLRDNMLNHLVGTVNAANVTPGSLAAQLVNRFTNKGLTLPENLLVLGTVNMDETTFSFSRKVLDRAMSIVMNDVDYNGFFSGASANNIPIMNQVEISLLINREISGLNLSNNGQAEVQKYLTAVNQVLDNTPFKLGYRAANEALLYVEAAAQFSQNNVNVKAALDEFTMMKILSRIEGNKRSIGDLLDQLAVVIDAQYPKSNDKLLKMKEALETKQFVSYWN